MGYSDDHEPDQSLGTLSTRVRARGSVDMDQPEFWRLIDKIDRGALGHGDEQGAVEPLVHALAAYDEEDIQAFEDILAQCRTTSMVKVMQMRRARPDAQATAFSTRDVTSSHKERNTMMRLGRTPQRCQSH